jgi:hypothetical protein
MLSAALHGASFCEAPAATAGVLAVVERLVVLVHLFWSKDLVVISLFFKDLFVTWLLQL